MTSYLPAILAALATALISAAAFAAEPTTRPATATLRATRTPAAAVVADLAKQVGASLPTFPPDLLATSTLPPVTADLADVSFWDAAREIAKQTGLEPVQNPEDPYPRFQWGLGGGTFFKPPHAVAGPLLVVATDVHRSSTIDLGRAKHDEHRDLSVSLVAYAAPGVRLLGVAPEVRLLGAVDDLKQSLLPPDAPAVTPTVADGAGGESGALYMTHLSVALNCPENRGKRIASLKGRIAVRLQTASQRVEWEDAMGAKKDATRQAGAFPVTLKSLKKADIEYVLSLSARRDKRNVADWSNLQKSIYNGHMALYDAKGRLVAARATENGGEYNGNAIDARLRFVREPGVSDADAKEPYKLVWDAPTAAKDVTFDFELMDVPIP
ncbi:MAG TPA: hypothetical protein VEA69_20800 [Tepidisphaeraceae bacterium]|nr:hypothetical protein [Tepidisphaeraceae bacterium]